MLGTGPLFLSLGGKGDEAISQRGKLRLSIGKMSV